MRTLYGLGSWSAALLAVVGALGCSHNSTDIYGKDTTVFMPSARAAWYVSRGDIPSLDELWTPAEREPNPPAPVGEFEYGVEGALGYGQGRSTQTYGAGESIMSGGTSFGPGPVRMTYSMYVYSLAAKLGMWLHEQVNVAASVGAGVADVHLKMQGGGKTERDPKTDVGPFVGAEVTYQPLWWLGVYGRGSTIIEDWDQGLLDGEAGLALTLLPGFTAFAGWRVWDYDRERSGDQATIRLNMSGPTAGIQITF